MKKIFTSKIYYFFFIILFLVGVFLILPVRKSFKFFTSTSVQKISDYLQDSIGISVSYESLAPSILSRLSLKNVTVSNNDKEQIVILNSVKIDYKLFKILKGDFQQGIKSITFDGIKVDISKVLPLIKENSTEVQEKKVVKNKKQLSLSELKRFFPYKCYFKNIIFFYNDNNFDASLKFNKISLNTDSISDVLQIDFFSNLDLLIKSNKITKNNIKIKSGIEFSGKIKSDFSNANVNLSFSNITDGTFNFNKIGFYAGLDENILEVRTVQSVIPLNFNFLYNVSEQNLKFSLQTQKLKPIELFSKNFKKNELKNLKDISFSSITNFAYNIKQNQMTYDSEGSLIFPKESLYDGFDISYAFSGNEQNINVEYLNVSGQNCNANLQAEYIYKTMQLYGFANISDFTLPNGNVISTELFFDPLDEGFMIFSPQVFIGEKALTALQFSFMPQKQSSTYDFAFEVSDYSHLEESNPGIINVNGSYLQKSNYIQANASINTFFVDSIAEFVASVLNKKDAEQVKKTLPTLYPYMLSGDAYFSTDFKTFSYNIPYVIVANTQQQNQVVMLSLNGNDNALQIDNFSLIYNKIALECAGTLETSKDTHDLLFTLNLKSGSVPYSFSGSKSNDVITISGDYDFFAMFDWSNIANNNEIAGSISFNGLPIVVDDTSVILTSNIYANYDNKNGPFVNILNFETELSNSNLIISPKFRLNGNVTKYGAQINSISYTDAFSLLEGYANVMYNTNESIFDSASVQLNLSNPSSEEEIILDAKFSNPDLSLINFSNIFDSLYMDLQLRLNQINLNRIAKINHESNLLTGSVFASGTVKHPHVVVNLEKMRLLLASNFMDVNGIITLEDKELSIDEFTVDFSTIQFNNIKLKASLENFTAHAEATLTSEFDGLLMNFPMFLDITETEFQENSIIPKSFKVDFNIRDTYGPFLLKPIHLSLSGVYANNLFSIFANDNSGIFGTFTTDGNLNVVLDAKDFVKANLNGTIGGSDVSLKLSVDESNLNNIFSYLDTNHIIQILNGNFQGNVELLGSLSSPKFFGAAKIENPIAKLPLFCKDEISTRTILLTIQDDEIRIIPNVYKVKNREKISAEAVIYMNKWMLDHIEASVCTLQNEFVKGGLDIPEFKGWGDVAFDFEIYYEDYVVQVDGNIYGENVDFSSGMTNLSTLNSRKNKPKNPIFVCTDLDLRFGTHVKINFEPLLRCILVPNTKMRVVVDQLANQYQLLGDISIKSGDIAYLNRNFYIKTGKIIFNSEDIANPMITLTAETREKDEKGENVRIILSVENQYLESLTPKISSMPAKSEAELRTLLGDIIMADAENAGNFLLAAGDYAIQSAIFRKAENKLRDLMNFDIFSLRTNILQNTMKYGASNQNYKAITPASLLDNTTLYIGKYLTSAIYFDAMLHVTLDDKLTNNLTGGGTLIFQPEIGLELESPFLNIRWNLAPDISAMLKKQFVPSTSVTLSWKMAF